MEGHARRLILVLVLVATILVPSAPDVAAANQTMAVIVVPTNQATSLGATVTATIHVFRYGVHADPTTLTVSTWGRSLTATHTGTGLYEVTFVVQSSDAYYGYVYLNAAAAFGTLNETGYAYLWLNWFLFELSVPVSTASPGDTVDLTARFRENGSLVDPDSITVTGRLSIAGSADVVQDLSLAHSTTGTYTGSFVVPPGLTQAGRLSFSGSGRKSGFSDYAYIRVGIGIPGNPTTVWYRPVTRGLTSGTMDVFVANATGWPVAGAAISGTHEYYTGSGTLSGTFSGVTNASGAARVTLSYPGATDGPTFRGTATAGSASVGFAGYLEMPTTYLISVQDPKTGIQAPGSTASVRSRFYLDGQPIAGQTVYFYASSDSAFVTSGTTTTNATGGVSVSFVMPSQDVQITYSVSDGASWHQGWGYVAARPLATTHNVVHAGSTLQVSVPSFPVPVREVIITFQGKPPAGFWSSSWSLASGTSWASDILYPTAGSAQYSLQLPRFLPKGQDYYLWVTAIPEDQNIRTSQYVDVIHIDNLPPAAAAVSSSSTPAPGDSITVNAASSSDPDGSLVAYRYAWGDGATTDWTSNATATHTYANAGDYTVTVSVRDDYGAESSTTLTVKVQSPTGVLLLVGLPLAIVAVAAVAFVLWRRSRRPPAVAAPQPAPPTTPAAPETPPSGPPPGSPPTPP